MKVKLSNVRLSFPALFEAEEYKGKYTYRAKFLIDPASQAHRDINAAIRDVAAEKFGKKADIKLEEFAPSKQQYPYLDGRRVDFEGAEGMWVLTGTRRQDKGRPLVIDRNKSQLAIGDGKPYSGCYVNATVDFWAQDGENPGIRCELLGVQYHRDGDSFVGGGRASPDDFDDVTEGATADDLV